VFLNYLRDSSPIPLLSELPYIFLNYLRDSSRFFK